MTTGGSRLSASMGSGIRSAVRERPFQIQGCETVRSSTTGESGVVASWIPVVASWIWKILKAGSSHVDAVATFLATVVVLPFRLTWKLLAGAAVNSADQGADLLKYGRSQLK